MVILATVQDSGNFNFNISKEEKIEKMMMMVDSSLIQDEQEQSKKPWLN